MSAANISRTVRRLLAIAITVVGVSVTATVIPQANADEPYQPRPVLTVTGAEDWYSPCPPCSPVGPIGLATHQSISLRWTDNRTDETAYRLYRVYPNGGGSTTLVREFAGHSGTGHVYLGFGYGPWPFGTAACLYLHAVTSSPQNNDSTTVCGAYRAPGKPGTPQVVWSDADRADIEFARSSTYEAFYKVYIRRSGTTTWTSQMSAVSDGGAAAAGKKRLRVTGLQPSTSYCFKVSGIHSLSESAQTTETCGSTRADPTAGWTSYSDSFYIVKPYNVPQSDRFNIVGARDYYTWVCKNDKPFAEGSETAPRTEIAWERTYTSGSRMWEADVYIVGGTADSNIMQIFHAESDHDAATDLRVRVRSDNGGTLRAYRHANAVPPEPDGTVFASGMYNRWFNLKVAHYTATHLIYIYIDDRLMLTIPDSGPDGGSQHRFKNGVYGSAGGTVDSNLHCPAGGGRAEARFRYFKFWSK